jgi:hypothetical protein
MAGRKSCQPKIESKGCSKLLFVDELLGLLVSSEEELEAAWVR